MHAMPGLPPTSRSSAAETPVGLGHEALEILAFRCLGFVVGMAAVDAPGVAVRPGPLLVAVLHLPRRRVEHVGAQAVLFHHGGQPREIQVIWRSSGRSASCRGNRRCTGRGGVGLVFVGGRPFVGHRLLACTTSDFPSSRQLCFWMVFAFGRQTLFQGSRNRGSRSGQALGAFRFRPARCASGQLPRTSGPRSGGQKLTRFRAGKANPVPH